MPSFNEWKQELLAREPIEISKKGVKATALQVTTALNAAHEVNRLFPETTDYDGNCSECGMDMLGMSIRDRALHYLDEELGKRDWHSGPPDSIEGYDL